MNKKKLLSLTLGVSMMLTTFVGCGSKNTTEPTTDPTTTVAAEATKDDPGAIKGEITFVSHRTDMINKGFNDYAKKFNEKYPNIKVNFEALKNYENDIAVRMSSPNYGDVVIVPSQMKATDLPNYFEPLGKRADLSQKYQFPTDRYFGDEQYAVPIAGNASGIVYNKKVFGDAGITELPKSHDEFLDALRMIKEKTKAVPLYTNYKDNWPLTQWESYRVNVAGDPNFVNRVLPHDNAPFSKDKPHYIVYKLMYDVVKEKLVEKDPMTTNWESSKQMLANGEIATMALGSWAVGQIKAMSKNPDDIAYMPFPYNKEGKMFASASGDYGIGINKNSKNIEAAKAFVWWFLDESNYAFNEAMIPPVKGAAYPETLKAFQELGVELILDNEPKEGENGWLDAIDKEGEIGLWAENFKKDIVETALGNKKGRTYDDIMNGLNKKWSDSRKKLIANKTIGE